MTAPLGSATTFVQESGTLQHGWSTMSHPKHRWHLPAGPQSTSLLHAVGEVFCWAKAHAEGESTARSVKQTRIAAAPSGTGGVYCLRLCIVKLTPGAGLFACCRHAPRMRFSS